MRNKHLLWLGFLLLALIPIEGPSLAGSASDVVQGPVNVAVTYTPLEDLILTIFEGTGVQVSFQCPAPEVLVSMTRAGDSTIAEVLDVLLRDRDYCWWTLGCRLYVDKAVKGMQVQRGTGFLHNRDTGQTTILGLSRFVCDVEVVDQYTVGSAFKPPGPYYVGSYERRRCVVAY